MNDSPAIWCPHVTVAAVVADGDRFLMVEEAIRGQLMYNQPAGHLEPDESLLQAVCREALEETAWDIEPTCLIGVHQWRSPLHDEHIVRFSFGARALRQHPERALDTGIQRALWLPREHIVALGERLRSPLVVRSIDAWLGGRRLPLDCLESLLPGTDASPCA